MPDDCDCVVDSDSVDQAGPMVQVLAEAIPGQGVRRAGGDRRWQDLPLSPPVGAFARAISWSRAARACDRLKVRRPRLRIVNIPAISGDAVTAQLIAETARAAGAEIVSTEAAGSRSRIDRKRARRERVRSPGDDRRHRGRPHRCDRRRAGEAWRGHRAWHCAAARTDIRHRPGSETFPSLRCRARRIRRSGHGGRSRLPALDGLSGPREAAEANTAAGTQGRLTGRHRRNCAA